MVCKVQKWQSLTLMTRPTAKDLLNLHKDYLKQLLKEESHQTSCELAEKISCHQKTILNHLYSMGFAEKLKVWVPYDLGENNKEKQIASQHLACH